VRLFWGFRSAPSGESWRGNSRSKSCKNDAFLSGLRYDSPERLAWNLYIVTEAAQGSGPLDAYTTVQQALARLNGASLSLGDIVILGPHRSAFQDLRRTIEGVSQMSASGDRVKLEGVPLQDAYVYRWSYD
jgi:hypothetical protein